VEQSNLLYRTSCPVCDHDRFTKELTCIDYTVSREEFQIVKCEACGFKFTNPIPAPERLGDYYKSENYISHSDTRKGLISRLYHAVRSLTLRQKVALVARYTRKGSLLDYGCGTGMFLRQASGQGWTVVGLEPDDGARKTAAASGVTVYAELGEISAAYADGSFSAITLWHVLEHVVELKGTLATLRSKLADDGIMIVAVPNPDSFDARHYGAHWAAYDVPRHLYHFSPAVLSALMSQAGLELVSRHPMKFDSFYVSLLSEKYRHGRTRYLPAFMTGLRSNWLAKRSGNYSSLIYVLRKSSAARS
jgi:2-polyprenyl-3-methyl-5-hydroxy-6-metoxy-1,4-benzoquinol methylase